MGRRLAPTLCFCQEPLCLCRRFALSRTRGALPIFTRAHTVACGVFHLAAFQQRRGVVWINIQRAHNVRRRISLLVQRPARACPQHQQIGTVLVLEQNRAEISFGAFPIFQKPTGARPVLLRALIARCVGERSGEGLLGIARSPSQKPGRSGLLEQAGTAALWHIAIAPQRIQHPGCLLIAFQTEQGDGMAMHGRATATMTLPFGGFAFGGLRAAISHSNAIGIGNVLGRCRSCYKSENNKRAFEHQSNSFSSNSNVLSMSLRLSGLDIR